MSGHPAYWTFDVQLSADRRYVTIELTSSDETGERMIGQHRHVLPYGIAASLTDRLDEVCLDRQAVIEEHRGEAA